MAKKKVRRGSSWRAGGPRKKALPACRHRHRWEDWQPWANGEGRWRECGRCGLIEDQVQMLVIVDDVGGSSHEAVAGFDHDCPDGARPGPQGSGSARPDGRP